MMIRNSGGIGPGYAYGAWSWNAPPGAFFSDLFFRFNLVAGSGHTPSVTVVNPGGGLVGRWTSPPFPPGWNSIDTIPITGSALTAWLECGANCAWDNGVHTWVRDLYFTINDYTPPQITGHGGEVLSGGVRRGTETLGIAAADNASLTGLAVRANGVVIEERVTSCPGLDGGPATSFDPCQTSASWSVPINTELLPDGQNAIEVCVRDLSFDPNARNTSCQTRLIQVDNSCPSSGGPAPASAIDAVLQSGNGPARESIRTTSTRSAVARGTLAGPADVAGSTVCLYERVDLPGDGRELVDTAKVRSNGSFALDVDPGPSRLFDVVYRYNDTIAEKERLYLDSTVVPTFKVVGRRSLVNGQNVRFRGRLPGPNAGGRGISLQARVGRKWRTFKQVRANSKGKYRGLYRFTQTQGRATYVFRARVKRQGNYPYSAGSSKRRKVNVRG
jgi:hypothetical protein